MTRDGRPSSRGTKAEWSRFDQTLTHVRAGFADLSADELKDLVDQAVTNARRSVRKAPDPQHDDE